MEGNNLQMSYRIKRNVFAPKLKQLTQDFQWQKAHSICYDKCNFHCGFCNVRNWDRTEFHDYSEREFELTVMVLARDGNRFKFIGGEPTLNPTLERDMAIVRKHGGVLFLDTNGSRPDVIGRLMDNKLVDVLALSIKGMDSEEAMRVAEIRNPGLCWDNLFKSLRLAEEHPEVLSMLTVVLTAQMNAQDCLERVGELLRPYPHVRLKINNLHENIETQKRKMEANDPVELGGIIARFAENHPEYRGRIVYEPSHSAVLNYEELQFY